MRIGFASVYAWRPHVEHLMFLAGLARQAGHETVFLACDADLPACYTRELRDVRPDWMECLFCRVGGVRSFTASGVSSIGALDSADSRPEPAQALEWAASSASTLGRFESAEDYRSAEFAALRGRLAPSVQRAYSAARQWIARERLDAVCVFNGRMDATRAIFEAARDSGKRVISLERSWFGDGLQLLPDENCLGLRSVHALVDEWSFRPLTRAQALHAAGRVAARLTRTNTTEWRAYNTQAARAAWPVEGGRRKLLLLPGSLNEIWGDPGWESAWRDPTDAYDAIMERLGLSPQDLVLRCHPNWGERIGKNDGRLPERHYTDWARARGIHVIASADSTSTMDLIAHCDAIVVASGSAALEAAAMGKQVIATAPSIYQEAGFRTDASDPARLQELVLQVELPAQQQAAAQRRARRLALRFCYAMSRRLPQYAQQVRALSSSAYRYAPGADPQRFLELVRTGQLKADDASFADSEAAEDEVLVQMERGEWRALVAPPAADADDPSVRVNRRWLLRPIDYIREKMPVGDR
ncbi:hypothetical protein GCM10027034_23850 [Ramlibacter solisilvae]|uniref:Capsule polysaccharide biosynthesis protein n=1 Tax=Ramlibacter tataouinensis TaxID=94132 RepID=A0A127JQ70_9BURK|nr:hypothetical protein [Ramlibacter tataouinensis]AMO22089.1 hypothetical protein UC35_03345 [Ramlibacter tataouinensis]